jgi:hypothetical protein
MLRRNRRPRRLVSEMRFRCTSRNASDNGRRKTTRPATRGVSSVLLGPQGGNGTVRGCIDRPRQDKESARNSECKLTRENSAAIARARCASPCVPITGCATRGGAGGRGEGARVVFRAREERSRGFFLRRNGRNPATRCVTRIQMNAILAARCLL